MADSKLVDLTADASPTGDDLIYVVNDPGGTPADRKVTLTNLAGSAPFTGAFVGQYATVDRPAAAANTGKVLWDTDEQAFFSSNGSVWAEVEMGGAGVLDWVSVTDHGAVGDGTTDDTVAIQAALDATPQGGVCYFPVPVVDYKVTAALDIPHTMRITGAGSFIGRYTRIRQATAHTDMFVGPTTLSEHILIDGLELIGTSGGQIAGAAITVSQSVQVDRCYIRGFQDCLLVTVDNSAADAAYYCTVKDSFFDSATRAGVRLVGIVNNFLWQKCRATGNATGVQIVGGPYGVQLYGGDLSYNTIGIDIDGEDSVTEQPTTAVIISGVYMEQEDGDTDVRIGNGTGVSSVRIESCPFIKPNLTGGGWHILATNVDGLTITDCEFTSTQAVSVSSPATGVVYGRNHNLNSGTVTLPAGTIRLDAAAVTPSNLDGTAAAAGTSHYLARADHEHGPVVIPGGVTATGTPSSSTYLRGDGAWATPAGSGGAIRVEDEGSTVVAAATGINFVGAGVVVTDAGSDEATVTISGSGSGGPTVVYKTADETVTSSATLQDDNHLVLPVGAGEVWCIDYTILYTAEASSGATGDPYFALNAPTGSTGTFAGIGAAVTVTSDTGDMRTLGTTSIDGTAMGTWGGVGATTPALLHLTAFVTVGGTGGNVVLQWAQGTSSATGTTLLKGSHLVAYQVA